MSLKGFHVLFIALAILLCLGFGWWCVVVGQMTGVGVFSFAAAVALMIYGVLFLKKLKKVSML